MRQRLSLAALFLFTLGCDQATKLMATNLPRGGKVIIPGFFNLIYAENPGVAFSRFVGVSPTLLAFFGFVMTAVLLVTLWRTSPSELFNRIGYTLILGGALGNLVDRVRLGHVIDFISWHIGDRFYWPVFNPADAAIVIGIGFLFLQSRMQASPQGDTTPRTRS